MRSQLWRGGVRRALLSLGLTLLLAASAACSGDGEKSNGLEKLPAGEVGTRTLQALRAATGVHVVGTEADPRSDAPARYDLVMSGTVTRGTIDEYGQRTQIIKIKDDTYVHRGRAYYEGTGDAAAGSLLADRWVRLAPADAAKYSYFTLDRLAASLTSYVVGLSGPVRTEKLAGTQAVRAASPGGTAFWAANTGPGYPLKVVVAGRSTNEITFDDYGTPAAGTPPGDVVDLSNLG
ncbi:hypothetical protein [Frankia sp. CcWB3]